jgi:hypothetical protein
VPSAPARSEGSPGAKVVACATRRAGALGNVAELVDGQPRLIFLVEFDDVITDDDGSALVDRLDDALGDPNSEYRVKRKSARCGAPVIRIVRPGEFDEYRRRMAEQGRADGQFKILRLTSDSSFAAESKPSETSLAVGGLLRFWATKTRFRRKDDLRP